jgi:hypothetical protein
MSASAIFDAVLNRMRAELPNVQGEFGAEFNGASGSPPRMVWVPSTDEFGGDPKRGPRTQPAIYQVDEGYDVHLWGADYNPTRDLRDVFLRAFHRELMGSGEPERGEWVPGNASLVKSGRLYVLSIRVQVPVTQTPLQTATPAGVTEIQTVQQP